MPFAAFVGAGLPLPAHADSLPVFGGMMEAASKVFETDEAKQLGVYFAQTLISWGVPAAVALFLIVVTNRGPSTDEPQELPPALAKALGLSKEPKEYLKIERLNSKLLSFDYSLAKATVSKESALRDAERLALKRRFGAEVAAMGLDSASVRAITTAADKFAKAEAQTNAELDKKLRTLRAATVAGKRDKDGKRVDASGQAAAQKEEAAAPAAEATVEGDNATALANDGTDESIGKMGGGMFAMRAMRQAQKEVGALQERKLGNELAFLSTLGRVLSPEQASKVAAIFKPANTASSADPGGSSESAVALLAESAAGTRAAAPHVFVLKFFGDVTASQVSTLRQEVTAVMRNVDKERGDEVVLVLNTGGGTVTGYGLAAAQLTRITTAGVHLTICVEQVAASGGYMMACVADKILAAPFAVLGSIGVITEQPNVYERLKKEGVVFSTVTAGKYKRTLTPTKKLDPQDEAKLKEDIEQILQLFKTFVAKNRPALDIDKVATGETWFGPDALANGLVDGLTTVDEVLVERVEQGAEVLAITYQEKPKSPLAALGAPGGDAVARALAELGSRSTDKAGLQTAALMAMARLLGVTGGGELGSGGASEFLRGRSLPIERTDAFEQAVLAARPKGEAEPMMQWRSEEEAEDSWFL